MTRHGSLSEAKTTCRTMGSQSSTEMGQSRCHNKKPRQQISGFQAGELSIGNQLENLFGSFTHFFGDLLETLNQSCVTALEVLPMATFHGPFVAPSLLVYGPFWAVDFHSLFFVQPALAPKMDCWWLNITTIRTMSIYGQPLMALERRSEAMW